MGFSRVWLGQHHPIDIVGGMLLGSIAARCIACERLPMGKEEQQTLANKKYEKKRVNKITSLKDALSLALLLKQREY